MQQSARDSLDPVTTYRKVATALMTVRYNHLGRRASPTDWSGKAGIGEERVSKWLIDVFDLRVGATGKLSKRQRCHICRFKSCLPVCMDKGSEEKCQSASKERPSPGSAEETASLLTMPTAFHRSCEKSAIHAQVHIQQHISEVHVPTK